jgi:hypothetical protein
VSRPSRARVVLSVVLSVVASFVVSAVLSVALRALAHAAAPPHRASAHLGAHHGAQHDAHINAHHDAQRGEPTVVLTMAPPLLIPTGELEALLGLPDARTIPKVVRLMRYLEQTGA